jgi:hypothetical protein
MLRMKNRNKALSTKYKVQRTGLVSRSRGCYRDSVLKTESIIYRFVTLVLRLGLVAALFAAGWLVYDKLPYHSTRLNPKTSTGTNVQIVLQPDSRANSLDIPIDIYPIDIVAARHEYFDERRAGKRFEDFLKDRMNGRSPIAARLNADGQGSIVVQPGTWWIHALLSGEEDLEWRLKITVQGENQTITLTPENAYTRAKSF